MADVAAPPYRGARRLLGLAGQWRQFALPALSIALLLLLWWVGGAWTTFVPPIGQVLRDLPGFLAQPDVPRAIGATTVRVLGSLAVALAVGLVAALAMHRGKFWGKIVESFVNFGMGFPSTIAALLALYIFRRSPVSVYVVVAFITFPFIATILRQGLARLDHRLHEMGAVYGFSGFQRLRHLVVPQLVPLFFAALRNEYAHAWKVVVLAEVFAVNSGMGWQFSQAFDRFLLNEVLLWLLVFMAILLSSEYLVIRPLEKHWLRWRER